MARQTKQMKATPENNYTIEVVWHKAKHFPKKSGTYLVYMKTGFVDTVRFSRRWKLYNYSDLFVPEHKPAPDTVHNNVVAWAELPDRKFMVECDTKPEHEVNSTERYLCSRDSDGYTTLLFYNQFLDIFNSTDDDTPEEAERYEIEVDRWCRIAPPEGRIKW